MFIDLYALQTVPPSNINRDDTGSPKTAMYGGARRARVSSQAWKRAMRQSFSEYLPEGSLGVRTKFAAELLGSKISDKRPDLKEMSAELAAAAFRALGIKIDDSKRSGDDEGKMATGYLVFIARHELDGMADVAIGWADENKDLKKLDKRAKKEIAGCFHGVQAVDIALFGRMLADVPELNTDASAQVAHAISVDRVTQEFDYYTAVDDCAAKDNTGAGMIGTVDFNSSTLYRYATVNVDSLLDQLGDAEATARGVKAFVEAFVRSMPTGKQNTFANRTLPSYVVVSLRDAQPINVVSAFEDPVRPRDGEPISLTAAKRMGERIGEIERAFGLKAKSAWYVSSGEPLAELDSVAVNVDFPQLVENVRTAIDIAFGAGE